MAKVVAIKTKSLPATANNPQIDLNKLSFDELLIKNGVFHFFSDLVSAGSNDFFIVPKGQTFFITSANCSAFGTGAGALAGIGLTTPLVAGYTSDFLLTCSHMASQTSNNNASFPIPIKAGELTQITNVSVGANTSCLSSVAGYLIDNSFLN